MRGQDWRSAQAIARTSLDAVSLGDKYRNVPSQLSGGEQQRVAIARAIAGKPKIIFADEPTANLDSASGNTVIDILRTLHLSGQTIVMVTHEVEYTVHCDRIVRLADGLVVKEEVITQRTTPSIPDTERPIETIKRFPLPHFGQ